MNIELVEAYTYKDETKTLFNEYTEIWNHFSESPVWTYSCQI